MNLDADAMIAHLKKQVVRGMSRTLQQAKDYAQEISPTDTKEYINNREIVAPQVQGNTVKGSLMNATEHAQLIERGVMGRAYDYHKGPPRNKATTIYTGVGNRTAQRTADQTQSLFQTNIANA